MSFDESYLLNDISEDLVEDAFSSEAKARDADQEENGRSSANAPEKRTLNPYSPNPQRESASADYLQAKALMDYCTRNICN